MKQYFNMSDLIFVLSDQNRDLVGDMSFQEKKLFAALNFVMYTMNIAITCKQVVLCL